MPGRRSMTSQILDKSRRIDPADVAARFAERDARLASDTRTELERYFGDPDPSRRSVLTPAPGPTATHFGQWSQLRRRV